MVKFVVRDRITAEELLNLESRIPKIGGSITTVAGVAGSVVVPGSVNDGNIWFTYTPVAYPPTRSGSTPTHNEQTLSWGAGPASHIIYGRF